MSRLDAAAGPRSRVLRANPAYQLRSWDSLPEGYRKFLQGGIDAVSLAALAYAERLPPLGVDRLTARLLELHRHTGQRRWLTAATELAVTAAASVDNGNADGCISGSLHKGEVGVALLAADLARSEAAAMPFFGFQG